MDGIDDLLERPLGPPPIRTPHPRLAEERRLGPIVEISPDGRAARPAEGVCPEGKRTFKALSYEAVTRVLKHPEAFSSRAAPPHFWIAMGHTILHMDDPQHGLYRGAFRQLFTPARIAAWEGRVVRPAVKALVDDLVGRGRADLVRQFTRILPLRVVMRVIGIPEDSYRSVHRWIVGILSSRYDLDRAVTAANELSGALRGLIAARRARPEEDIISYLLELSIEGRPLTEYEILSFLRLLVPTGFETTFRSLGNLLFGLLTHPAQLEAIRVDRGLIDQAIEEGLRWESSELTLPRHVTREFEVAGVSIPAGSTVLVSLASANRDEAAYRDPESFDIHRAGPPHTSFGAGPHYCIGSGLSRMEMRVALSEILDRLPGIRLDPAWEDPHIHGDVFRAPDTLPVLFDA